MNKVHFILVFCFLKHSRTLLQIWPLREQGVKRTISCRMLPAQRYLPLKVSLRFAIWGSCYLGFVSHKLTIFLEWELRFLFFLRSVTVKWEVERQWHTCVNMGACPPLTILTVLFFPSFLFFLTFTLCLLELVFCRLASTFCVAETLLNSLSCLCYQPA